MVLVLNGIGYPAGARLFAFQVAERYSTVEKQFDSIEQELEKHPQRVAIEYDPDDSHPTRVYFGNGITTDGDYGFTITNFTRLPVNDSPAGQKEK
jgi:hypothetical protein